jgi:hypothetical protein
MAGGDLSEATGLWTVFIRLGREAFLSLCTEKKHWKNQHMLTRKTVETKTPNPKRGIRECKSKYFNLKLTLGFPFGG